MFAGVFLRQRSHDGDALPWVCSECAQLSVARSGDTFLVVQRCLRVPRGDTASTSSRGKDTILATSFGSCEAQACHNASTHCAGDVDSSAWIALLTEWRSLDCWSKREDRRLLKSSRDVATPPNLQGLGLRRSATRVELVIVENWANGAGDPGCCVQLQSSA